MIMVDPRVSDDDSTGRGAAGGRGVRSSTRLRSMRLAVDAGCRRSMSASRSDRRRSGARRSRTRSRDRTSPPRRARQRQAPPPRSHRGHRGRGLDLGDAVRGRRLQRRARAAPDPAPEAAGAAAGRADEVLRPARAGRAELVAVGHQSRSRAARSRQDGADLPRGSGQDDAARFHRHLDAARSTNGEQSCPGPVTARRPRKPGPKRTVATRLGTVPRAGPPSRRGASRRCARRPRRRGRTLAPRARAAHEDARARPAARLVDRVRWDRSATGADPDGVGSAPARARGRAAAPHDPALRRAGRHLRPRRQRPRDLRHARHDLRRPQLRQRPRDVRGDPGSGRRRR